MLGAAHRSPGVARTAASELGVRQVVAEPTRRLTLAALVTGSLTLAGCKGIAVLGPVPKPSTDVVSLERAIAAEELMVARYQAVLSSGTARHVSAAIRRVHAEHLAHLRQLRSRLILPPKPAASTLSASPGHSPSPPPLPHGRGRVLAALAAAENEASDRLIGWIPAVPPALAQLMASIAASEATHVVLLSHRPGTR